MCPGVISRAFGKVMSLPPHLFDKITHRPRLFVAGSQQSLNRHVEELKRHVSQNSETRLGMQNLGWFKFSGTKGKARVLLLERIVRTERL